MNRTVYQREYYAAETFEERSKMKRVEENRIAKGFVTVTNEPQFMDANSFTFCRCDWGVSISGYVKGTPSQMEYMVEMGHVKHYGT